LPEDESRYLWIYISIPLGAVSSVLLIAMCVEKTKSAKQQTKVKNKRKESKPKRGDSPGKNNNDSDSRNMSVNFSLSQRDLISSREGKYLNYYLFSILTRDDVQVSHPMQNRDLIVRVPCIFPSIRAYQGLVLWRYQCPKQFTVIFCRPVLVQEWSCHLKTSSTSLKLAVAILEKSTWRYEWCATYSYLLTHVLEMASLESRRESDSRR